MGVGFLAANFLAISGPLARLAGHFLAISGPLGSPFLARWPALQFLTHWPRHFWPIGPPCPPFPRHFCPIGLAISGPLARLAISGPLAPPFLAHWPALPAISSPFLAPEISRHTCWAKAGHWPRHFWPIGRCEILIRSISLEGESHSVTFSSAAFPWNENLTP